MPLSDTLLFEKNLLSNTHPWFVIVDIEVTPGTWIYLVRNTESIVYNGNTYLPFPFKIGNQRHTSKGEIPTIQFMICNINQVMQAYIEEYDGLIGSTIILRLVNAEYLTEDYADLTVTFEVLTCSSDAEWATFECGAPNPMRRRFPLYRFIGAHCNFGFKSMECGYIGSETTCNKTLADCEAKLNSPRFGGFKGLVGKGMRVA